MDTHLTAFFNDNLGKAAAESKIILNFNEVRSYGVAVASAGL